MNLLYMKYAVEIATCGSLNKAAEKLYVGQPNLSRAIKELESSLGVTIFERSAKGMVITPDGEIFLKYAKSILSQVDAVENIFKNGSKRKKHFSISVPRASYISEAFARFSELLIDENEVEVFYKETNSMRAIKNILQEDYKLGILRYAENFDKYYKDTLDEKGLRCELITEFHYVLIMSADSPLAKKEELSFVDLSDYIEIAHADPYVPSLPLSEVKKEELPEVGRRIFVFERASQFELLSSNTNTFMWVSPVPEKLLKRYGLVSRICSANKKIYKDIMIYRNDYTLSNLDKAFISELCNVKREIFKDVAL
ncbi:MAG: LysR family transcriptional regulator [Ruminococcus sp.]|nr:LysR family transcriptional regulator [Ruminococcus sp.]